MAPVVVVVPPALELPPDPVAEVPPVAPPFELPVVPPDLAELLVVFPPVFDAPPLEPPEADDDPPELESLDLDAPPELPPADELALLLFEEPPEDDELPADDDFWLEPPCPARELLLSLDPPELLLESPELPPEFRVESAVSSALHPPRAGRMIREEANKIAQFHPCLFFFERIINPFGAPRKATHVCIWTVGVRPCGSSSKS